MTLSYALFIATQRTPTEVLEILFETQRVESIAGTAIQYVRGRTFLAHGYFADDTLCDTLNQQYGVRATVQVPFFPDGVSNFQTALDELLKATVRYLNSTSDDLMLLSNKEDLVLQRYFGTVSYNRAHTFWTPARLLLI